MYTLRDVRAGVIGDMLLVVYERYERQDGSIHWVVTVDDDDEMVWSDDDLPTKMRRLLQVLVLRESRLVPLPDSCYLYGPHLTISHQCIRLQYTHVPIGQKMKDIYGLGHIPGSESFAHIRPWVNEALRAPSNRKCIRMIRWINTWRRRAKDSKARVIARTSLLEEELVRVAWHPRRFQEWCLDSEEQRWLDEHLTDEKTPKQSSST